MREPRIAGRLLVIRHAEHTLAGPASCERSVERVDIRQSQDGAWTASRDTLVIEAPLELRIGGQPMAVIMRTPGSDHELVRGLLFAEGIIDCHEPLAGMHLPAGVPAELHGNVVELGIAPATPVEPRSLVSSSSCGVCGKTAIAEMARPLTVCTSGLTVPASVITGLPARLRAAQDVFASTGGLHAAAAFNGQGDILAVREDVGRHNAVDKLVGWALAGGRVPGRDMVLCVSGRLGFEIVQKAVAAGFPIVVAISAPSSLAVDLAERYRLTLCGFVRDQRFNIYSHPSRVS